MIRFLQTPSRAKKIILGGILLIICGAMVVTLVPGGVLGDAFGFGSPGEGVLAKVGSQDVTFQEAQQAARNMVRQQFRGQTVPPQFMSYFLERAVQSLVMQKALLIEAERMGLKVSDKELMNYLQRGPFGAAIFPGGQYIGQEQYELFVQQNFEQPVAQFERSLKDNLLITKLRNIVEGGVSVSESQLREAYSRRNMKVRFEYAVLNSEEVSKQIKPAEAELKAFYDQNKAEYANSVPEKRKAQFVFLSAATLKDKPQVTPDDLKAYYNQHMDEYRVPDEVKLRHILVKTPEGNPDQKAAETARAKAEDLLKKIKAGGNFAELAKKNSDDPGSGKEGGELGWIQRGRTVPEFEKAAFSMKPGEISGLVQSSYGFHIIQVEDKHTPRVKPLDEVKAQIEPVVLAQKAAKKVEAQASTLQTQAKTTGGLQAAAAKNGFEMITTPLVTRNDSLPAVGQSPEFMAAIFNAREKNPPEIAGLPSGYAVYQVIEVQPPSTPSFEEIKAKVEQDFRNQRTNQLLAQKLQQLSDRAKAEHNLKKAAAEVGATVKTSDLVAPEGQVSEIGALTGPAAVLFDMKPGEVSAPFQTSKGGAVAVLLEKMEPGPAEFERQKDDLRAGLLDQKRGEMFELFVDGLRARMEKDGKIQINKKELERLSPKQAS